MFWLLSQPKSARQATAAAAVQSFMAAAPDA
jgi:hypothetical protein